MKARDWRRYLEDQRRDHDKLIFTVTELANAADISRQALNVELGRLRKYGLIERYARGLYGPPGGVSPETLLPELDAHAYITGSYALFLHHIVAQVPVRITCFTDRRHGKARVRETPAGTFCFVCVGAPVYTPPSEEIIACPEQALCDYIYVCRRGGTDPLAQASFRNLKRLRSSRLRDLLARYPRTVAADIQSRLLTLTNI